MKTNPSERLSQALEGVGPAAIRVQSAADKLQLFATAMPQYSATRPQTEVMEEFAVIVRELRTALKGLAAHSGLAADAVAEFECNLQAAIRLQKHWHEHER